MLDLWYKNAILYCIDVETYKDANGDGVGDFEGLTQRLDYIAGLGITCIWLLPFYPTPNKDNGYDVMDYYNVDTRLGTLGDFVEFTRQANDRGIRVIVDLVINHTSDQHPWFQAACKDENSKYRNYYVWSKEKPEDADEGIVFPGYQKSTWTYNPEAGAYYFHRFYDHQADLNITNPQVREEIQKIMGFWLALGVSGFRVDAAQFLIEVRDNQAQLDVESPYHYLKEIRNFLSWRRGDAILLAEANVSLEELPKYFGDGDKMQMLFNFIVNQNLFLALAREKATPLVEALKAMPAIPETGQWGHFIRNHDELSLDKLSDAQQNEIADAFAPDKEQMWIFDRGIRRRFAPMVDSDPRRLRLAYSLVLTLPGTPVINYGEELGMGDDLSLEERNSARTPMQWSSQPNGEFSPAPPRSTGASRHLGREIQLQALECRYLLEEGITGNPDELKAEDLHSPALEIVQPYFEKAQQDVVNRYHELAGTGQTANTIQDVVPAAYYQRIESLFVPVGVQQWGLFNPGNSQVQLHQNHEPGDDDLMDFAAIHTLLNGGTVYAVELENIPDEALLVAVLRY